MPGYSGDGIGKQGDYGGVNTSYTPALADIPAMGGRGQGIAQGATAAATAAGWAGAFKGFQIAQGLACPAEALNQAVAHWNFSIGPLQVPIGGFMTGGSIGEAVRQWLIQHFASCPSSASPAQVPGGTPCDLTGVIGQLTEIAADTDTIITDIAGIHPADLSGVTDLLHQVLAAFDVVDTFIRWTSFVRMTPYPKNWLFWVSTWDPTYTIPGGTSPGEPYDFYANADGFDQSKVSAGETTIEALRAWLGPDTWSVAAGPMSTYYCEYEGVWTDAVTQVHMIYIGELLTGLGGASSAVHGLLPCAANPLFWTSLEPNGTEAAELAGFDTRLVTSTSELLAQLRGQLAGYGWTAGPEGLFPVGTSPHGTGMRLGVLTNEGVMDLRRHYAYVPSSGGAKRSQLGDLNTLSTLIPWSSYASGP